MRLPKLPTNLIRPLHHRQTDPADPADSVTVRLAPDLSPDYWVIKLHSGTILYHFKSDRPAIPLPTHTILANIARKPSGYLLITGDDKITIHASLLQAFDYYCKPRGYRQWVRPSSPASGKSK